MAVKDSYDVLRLIGHGKNSYVSSENVMGTPLIHWLKYHPHLEKERLFQWMRVIAEQLDQFHKCRGKPCYQYVNPYSVIVTEERELYFLDLGAESNEEMLRKMQQRSVREYFLPKEEAYYQKASVQLDIYGLGRTYQYLLSETEQEPPLTKREIIKLQKLISKCLDRHSKQVFQKVSDIQKYIPECKKTEHRKNKIFPAVTLLAVVFTVIFISAGKGQEVVKSKSENEGGQEVQEEETLDEKGKERGLEFELALLYFLKLQDYEESIRILHQMKGEPAAENLEVIVKSLGGGMVSEQEVREALREFEKELEGNNLSEKERCDYYECLLRGYAQLTGEEDKKELLRLGQAYERIAEEVPADLLANMADANEKCGQYEEALRIYDRMMEQTEDHREKEVLYEREAQVAVSADMPEKGLEILRKGIQELPESLELRIAYLKQQCEDRSIERAVCMVEIEEVIKELPAILEEKQFQKLMKEYGFRVEGGKVWEEN